MAQRVLIGKLGLDGHDVGAKIVCRALIDRGFEVVYTGLRRTPAEIARAAQEEDADAIGVSILSGAHLPLLAALARELESAGLGDRRWMVGGVLPARDHDAIRALGFEGIFPTGADLDAIADFVRGGER
jgi:methylmalonyl-CoA mutase C-terminal domain/subunit